MGGAAAPAAAYVFTTELFGEQSGFSRSISENDFVNALYHKIPALIRSVQIVTVAATSTSNTSSLKKPLFFCSFFCMAVSPVRFLPVLHRA